MHTIVKDVRTIFIKRDEIIYIPNLSADKDGFFYCNKKFELNTPQKLSTFFGTILDTKAP